MTFDLLSVRLINMNDVIPTFTNHSFFLLPFLSSPSLPPSPPLPPYQVSSSTVPFMDHRNFSLSLVPQGGRVAFSSGVGM